MLKKMAFIFFGLMLGIPTIALAGPFGTEMGENVSKFKDLTPFGSGIPGVTMYTTSNMPKTNTFFDEYILIFWKDKLAKIVAYGKPNEHDGYGINSQAEYNTLKESLTKKYGKPTKMYERKPPKGSVDAKPEFFVVSIYQKKRTHACIWSKDLPDNLESISLEIEAPKGYYSKVRIAYEYKNFNEVSKAQKKRDSDAL